VSEGPVFASAGVRVNIGGAEATVLGIDSSSGALIVQLPPFETLCPTTSSCAGARGYQRLSVRNPDTVQVSRSSGSEGIGGFVAAVVNVTSLDDSDNVTSLGGVVSCPPDCPGATLSDSSRGGIYYARSCTVTRGTSPGQLFGTGDSCSACTFHETVHVHCVMFWPSVHQPAILVHWSAAAGHGHAYLALLLPDTMMKGRLSVSTKVVRWTDVCNNRPVRKCVPRWRSSLGAGRLLEVE
jgi:hypothetical protein